MELEFDPDKDAINVEKHGVSLAMAAELEIQAVIGDRRRSYGEDRFNAYGTLRNVAYCLSFTWRNGVIRAISLRRARDKEYRRYVV